MVCDGVKGWPPKWLRTHGPALISRNGEIGTLEAVYITQVSINKVYLLIDADEGNIYLGTLMFEQPTAAQAVFDLFRGCINKTLTSIGALDLPENFGE